MNCSSAVCISSHCHIEYQYLSASPSPSLCSGLLGSWKMKAGRSTGVIVQVLWPVDDGWGMLVPEEVVCHVAVFPTADIAFHFNSPPQIERTLTERSRTLEQDWRKSTATVNVPLGRICVIEENCLRDEAQNSANSKLNDSSTIAFITLGLCPR
jgi:hypothetical protein